MSKKFLKVTMLMVSIVAIGMQPPIVGSRDYEKTIRVKKMQGGYQQDDDAALTKCVTEWAKAQKAISLRKRAAREKAVGNWMRGYRYRRFKQLRFVENCLR